AVLLDAVPQLVVGQAQGLGCLSLIPTMPPERMFDNRPLIFVHRRSHVVDRIVVERRGRRLRYGPRRGSSTRFGMGLRGKLPGRIKWVKHHMPDRLVPEFPAIDGTLHHIAQLSYIARPRILLKLAADMLGKSRPVFPPDLGRHAPPEIVRQYRNIPFSHTQGRKSDDFER